MNIQSTAGSVMQVNIQLRGSGPWQRDALKDVVEQIDFGCVADAHAGASS